MGEKEPLMVAQVNEANGIFPFNRGRLYQALG